MWYADPTSPQLEAPEDGLHGERRAPGLARSRANPPTVATTKVA
jgi:hypothetical protein